MVFASSGATGMSGAPLPRILLISQWPNVKNGEYELIEKIKQTGYSIAVVDYFGFNVDTDECVNRATLINDYDFAISFHYDTPKFLNIPTFLWVANPLEFMHLRGDYSAVLLHHLRSYDGYLYNGSDTLKNHIRNVVGSEWDDRNLEMFPSCSQKAMISPKTIEKLGSDTAQKVFYCGVNWERGIDRAGRAQGLLDILQEKQAADFYGPDKLEGISPWEGFSSYKGEIPFDGVSMAKVMQDYGAVLAVSSPAHIKSRTSSSRVFEGLAAGVPVISDNNAHVKKLFGDLVYYFQGETEEERAASILSALQQINQNPAEARDKVIRAQALLSQHYCFEPCFNAALAYIEQGKDSNSLVTASEASSIDVFLFHHDPDPSSPGAGRFFENLPHVIMAASFAARTSGVTVRIKQCGAESSVDVPQDLPPGVSWEYLSEQHLVEHEWNGLRLGEKVALLAQMSNGDFSTFLTQFDFPHYDSFSKAVSWFDAAPPDEDRGVHIAGFFVNDLQAKAPLGTVGIMRNNVSVGLYRWTQNSLAEHQLATLFFARKALNLLVDYRLNRFDAILPVSIIADAMGHRLTVHRSRHILMRIQNGYFHRHYEAYRKASERGFWAQHYDLTTNYNHELNALYDIHHESAVGRDIADRVSGRTLQGAPFVDPAVHLVNQFITRLRPIYQLLRKMKRSVFFWRR
ncbi:MAG: glycosyltransferase family protein [Pseudomonas sp.]|uniref:glycosyltransferase family protein n=1 Tax=Pseudomonas sp. TaxID=306 RepID=UPI003D0C1833